MLRHEVILRIKPGITREAIERTLRDVHDLIIAIPGVERVRYGVNKAPAYRHALVVIDLASEEALHRLSRHPQHARAARLLNHMAESTAVGSYVADTKRR